jgi:hypothetical protein
MIRFVILGGLALRYGETILSWFRNPVVQRSLVILIIVSIAGSIVSVYGWIRRSRA